MTGYSAFIEEKMLEGLSDGIKRSVNRAKLALNESEGNWLAALDALLLAMRLTIDLQSIKDKANGTAV